MVCDKSFFRVRNDRESLEFGTDGLGDLGFNFSTKSTTYIEISR